MPSLAMPGSAELKLTPWLLETIQPIPSRKKGITKSRIDVVKEMVNSGKYERLYSTFPLPLPMDKEKEIKNLTQLIAEPRQTKEFKSKNFVYEGSKPPKNIPQSVIDRLR